jgi:adenosylmethionine-8-amino-7-oxononanoate aminotransferase
LACAAALAVMDIFEQDQVIERNRQRIPVLESIAKPLVQHPRISNYRHRGMIWAFEVVDAPAGFAQRFHQAALVQGLLLRPIGNTVYFMPPYVISDEEFSLLVQGCLRALDEVLAS